MNFRELKALVKLLSDENSFILDQVEKKLKEYYDNIPLSAWSDFIMTAPSLSQKRLINLLRKFNHDKVINLMRNWLEKPDSLSEALFIISRVFNPMLEYHQFLRLFYNYKYYIPQNFSTNYSPLEQARFITNLIYKQEKFVWSTQPKLITALNPQNVLENNQGSHITIALIIVAMLQHFGIYWLVLSNMSLSHTFILVPGSKQYKLYFFIDPRTGSILNSSPLSNEDIEKIIILPDYQYNILSIKSLILAFLLDDSLPRELDDIWRIFNQFNAMLANYGKSFK